jgi:hypothetical protein
MEQTMTWLRAAEAVSSIISAIAWLVIALIALRLLPEIRRLAGDLEELALAGPMNTTLSLKMKHSITALGNLGIPMNRSLRGLPKQIS